jgi:ELWxxDGT repeat protein
MVRDINPSPKSSSNPYDLTAVGNTLDFIADDGVNGPALWTTNGWNAGTRLIRAFNPSSGIDPTSVAQLTAVGNQLFFTADTLGAGNELWVSDGSHAGTHLVKDIFPGSSPNPSGPGTVPNSSFPSSLTAFQGQLYFIADDGIHGNELWSSDGTADGTLLVQAAIPASGFNSISSLEAIQNALYFNASGGIHGVELWKFQT